MDAQSLSNRHKPGITTKACTPDFICGLHDVSKRITPLKKTGSNFSLWERDLKAMVGSITGTSDYFVRELHQLDPKFNRAVFNLIYWTIDKELQQDFMIDGSAGDAFQFLAGQFRSDPSTQCIMSRAGFPEEILDNIVKIVYHQSFQEHESIIERKRERVILAPLEDPAYIYRDPSGSPILNSFQTLAVVNRRFHRLCLPRLWQNIQFPSALPAPASIWTDGILLNRGNLVKNLKLELDNLSDCGDDEALGIERSVEDNTSPNDALDLTRHGIGLVNIKKIFTACPYLESVEIEIPVNSYNTRSFIPIADGLTPLLGLIPHVQRLKIKDDRCRSLPGEFMIHALEDLPSLASLEIIFLQFDETSSAKESLGWNLAQHQNLRELRLTCVTCEDQTWAMNSWPQRLTILELHYCFGLTPGMIQRLLSGSAPSLTRLDIMVLSSPGDSHVNGQTDLPALKQLILNEAISFEFLESFQSCKDLELIEYRRPINNDQWDLVKHFLSTRTWPKLSVLNLRTQRPSERTNDSHTWRKLTEKDVDEIWDSFKIELLID